MRNARYIIVIGCGRLGAYLANRLSRDGDAVVVIDHDETAFSGLSPEFGGFRVEGNATELEILKKARMEEADVVIAATRDDNTNIMAAQIAKKVFGITRVLARVYDPVRGRIYDKLGIDTVSPTALSSERFLTLIRSENGKENLPV